MSDATVPVPAQGQWLVRDGEVTRVVETDLKDSNSEYWTYEVYVDAPADEDACGHGDDPDDTCDGCYG